MAMTRTTLAVALACLAWPAAAATTVTFEDLATPPPFNSGTGIEFANGGTTLHQGVVWDRRFSVVGDEYRVDTATPGPLFGIPHSGRYFVTNAESPSSSGQPDNDGLLIITDLVLKGAWFGRNEYYGYGAGADRIIIHALAGSEILGTVSFDLPEEHPGEPEPLSFMDTKAFERLTGITGYRIDRRELGTLSGNWVADDFIFTPVPEADRIALLLAGLPLVWWAVRRNARRDSGVSWTPVRRS